MVVGVYRARHMHHYACFTRLASMAYAQLPSPVNEKARILFISELVVEHSGLEPLTSTLPVWHSTN